MNFENIKIRKELIRIQFLLLLFLSCLSVVRAQNKESVAVSELKAGDSIYIITNREIDTTSNALCFNTCVDEDAGLTFLKVS